MTEDNKWEEDAKWEDIYSIVKQAAGRFFFTGYESKEDIVQDIMLKIHILKLEHEQRGLIYTVARNHSIDKLRELRVRNHMKSASNPEFETVWDSGHKLTELLVGLSAEHQDMLIRIAYGTVKDYTAGRSGAYNHWRDFRRNFRKELEAA